MNQSAMITVPRLVTVAAGVFAPGHLGELTRYLPFELVDDVLESTGAAQKRMRALPSRVGMYFVLAMTLFPGLGYLRVWGKLTAALEGLGPAAPVGEGAAGPAPPDRGGPGEGPVRDHRGPAGASAGPGGGLPGDADGRVRRPELGQSARQRPEPVLAGEDDDGAGPGRVPGDADRGPGRGPGPAGCWAR